MKVALEEMKHPFYIELRGGWPGGHIQWLTFVIYDNGNSSHMARATNGGHSLSMDPHVSGI
jgi:hypothetical protein